MGSCHHPQDCTQIKRGGGGGGGGEICTISSHMHVASADMPESTQAQEGAMPFVTGHAYVCQ